MQRRKTMFVYVVKWDVAAGDYKIVGVYGNVEAALAGLESAWNEAVGSNHISENDLDNLGEMLIQNDHYLTESERAIRYPWRGMLISKEIVKEA
jgi:hypothetical protein